MTEYFLLVDGDNYVILYRQGYNDELCRHPDLPIFQDEEMAKLMLSALKSQKN